MNSSEEDYSTSRRGAIAAAGSLATVGLAGCSGDSSEGSADDSEGQGSSEDEPVHPNYDINLNLEDSYDTTQDEEIDLVENVDIFKILDGEASIDESGNYEKLESSEYEITNLKELYHFRDHPEEGKYQVEIDGEDIDVHSKEFYQEIGEMYEDLTSESAEVSSNQLLPGQTRIGLEIELSENGNTETVSTEDTTYIEANQEKLQEEVFIDNRPVWEKLREKYLEEELKNGFQEQFWEEAQRFEEVLMPEIKDKPLTRQYELIAREWIREARGITERRGVSTEANKLTNTLEYLIPSTYGMRNQDTNHDSTLAHDTEKGITAGVENRNSGETAVPPKELRFLQSEMNDNRSADNSLLNPDLNVMWSTLISIGELERPGDDSQFSFTSEFRETTAERLLNDEDVGEIYEFHVPLGLSREFNPSMDFHVEGTAENPEINIEQ